jgi:acetyl esterase/lipase
MASSHHDSEPENAPNPSPRTRNPLVALIVGIGLAAGQLANTRQDSATSGPQTLVYGSDPVQAIDFYEPSPAPQSGTSPLIVFVHGGAWSMGSRENATGNAKIVHFTSKGIAFATIGYRLVPDFRVEDQASDVAHAIARLLADAERLHIDRRRVILMGHSAGAHLVALVGTDPRWLDATGLSFAALQGVVAIDGAAYDVPEQLRSGAPLMRSLYRQAFGDDPERQQALSPLRQSTAPNAANWLLLHVDRPDGTRQTEALAAAPVAPEAASTSLPCRARAFRACRQQPAPGHTRLSRHESRRRLARPRATPTGMASHHSGSGLPRQDVRAAERLCAVVFRKRGNRAPADRTQTRGSLGIVTDGKENTVLDRFGTRDLIDQGIGEHREPRRNFAAIGPADAIGTTRPRTPRTPSA